jgi:hypothetical protein
MAIADGNQYGANSPPLNLELGTKFLAMLHHLGRPEVDRCRGVYARSNIPLSPGCR